MDFGPYLAKDTAWASTFYPDAFLSLKSASGQVWGIPEERDIVGIYYNKAMFTKAGIGGFPTTWDEFLADCEKLKSAGVIPIAMDGDCCTQLMWANLIGTQPGGDQFLASGIALGNFADNPIVVKATEFLKNLHTAGYTNKDAFTGDYPDAANPFLQEQAAMIANGPWMIQADIKGKSALPDLYSQVGYAPSPGSTADGQGAIVPGRQRGVGERNPRSLQAGRRRGVHEVHHICGHPAPAHPENRRILGGQDGPHPFAGLSARAPHLFPGELGGQGEVSLPSRQVRHDAGVHGRLEELLAGLRAGRHEHGGFP